MMRRRDEFIESEAARQVRLREAELMREAAAGQRICRRCGAPLDDADDAVCDQCQYNDLQSQEDADAS
jgi:ribosomal protein L40E